MRESVFQAPAGPNQWSNKRNIEQRFEFTEEELALISDCLPQLPTSLSNALAALGVDVARDFRLFQALKGSSADRFGQLYAAAAIAIQRSTGHDVSLSRGLEANYRAQCHCLFEYDHFDVGFLASKIVLLILTELVPGLKLEESAGVEGLEDISGDYRVDYEGLKVFAADRILPRDTHAIWEAANRLDVPCVHMERWPYEGTTGGLRVRTNGLLALGQGRFQKTIDGTFCPTLSAHLLPLIHDRVKRLQTIEQSEYRALLNKYRYRKVSSFLRAKRVAGKWSYPVRLSAANDPSKPLVVNGNDELHDAAAPLLRAAGELVIDQLPIGEMALLVFANGKPLTTIFPNRENGNAVPGSELHDSIVSATTQLVSGLNCGLVMFTLISSDFSRPLVKTGGAVIDIDFAPRLDIHLSAHESLLNEAAEEFVRWVFPKGSQSRIHSIAITGTNGKTTTTRMIERVLRDSGLKTGMVCTDGEYLNNEKQNIEPHQKPLSFHRQFDSADIDVAVLEYWFGRIRHLGFTARYYDVCICTNVTAEHRRPYAIADVAGVRNLKRAVMERAANAAVLNADDDNCLKMLPLTSCKKIFFTSLNKSRQELHGITERVAAYCIQEHIDGKPWVVLYDPDRIEVMPVDRIPATFAGAAKFNVSNAMQAICGVYALGIDLQKIKTTLSSFAMNAEETPWRLNFYDQYPPKILVDYAHNPGGVKCISEFAGQLQVQGKKIIAFSAYRSKEGISNLARAAAGHFDYYVCKPYGNIENYARGSNDSVPDNVLELMRDALLEAGVDEELIITCQEEMDGVDHALKVAQEGDLVLLLLGNISMPHVKQHLMNYYAGENQAN
jgi:UDP-N-acetylmuramyl tripeptide synthase